MSLINQMLRDLDARHAPTVDRIALPADLRALHAEHRSRRLQLAGLLAAMAAVAAGLNWPLWRAASAPPSAPPPALPAPSAAPPLQAPQPPQPPPELVAPAQAEPQLVAAAAPSEEAAPPLPDPAPAVPSAATDARPAGGKSADEAAGSARARKAGERARNEAMRSDPARNAVAARDAGAIAMAAPASAAPAAAPPAAGDAAAPAEAGSIDKRPRSGAANDAASEEYRRAMAALRRGAIAEAQDGLRATLRHDARHISARQALLSLLVEQQQWTEGQTLMQEGLALDPSQVGWTIALARLQLETGKLAEAAETLSRHARYADHNADYQGFHALLLQKLKRSREAAERYRAALAMRPGEARWWYGLGLALESDQKPQEAHEAFLKARDSGNLPPELASALEQRLR